MSAYRSLVRYGDLLATVLLLLGVAGGETYAAWTRPPEAPVYVSLAFQPNSLEDKDTLRRISQTFRDSLADVFSGLPKVKIKPDSFDADAIDVWTPANHVRAIQRLRWSPKVVLANTANVIGLQPGQVGLVILTEVVVPGADGKGVTVCNPIREVGTESEIRYVSLRAAFRLLKALRRHPALDLDENEDLQVKRRLLENFKRFLLVSDSSDAIDHVDAVAAQAAISDEDVSGALDSFVSGFDARAQEAAIKRTQKSVATKLSSLVQ